MINDDNLGTITDWNKSTVKLTRLEIMNALGIVNKDIRENYQNCIDQGIFSEDVTLDTWIDQREFIRWYICGDNKDVFLKQITTLHNYHLLIKRNETVDKIKSLEEKDLANFAEKLLLEIAEDTVENEELLIKINEILNK
jgi:hypothetical protein